MNEDPEYSLEDPVNNVLLEKEINKRKKLSIILSSIIIFLAIVIIVGIILYFKIGKKDNDSGTDKEYPEYSIYLDIKTSENKIIKNSFVKGSENYLEGYGEVNNGKNYEETDRDNFDLCILNKIMKNKQNYNTIYLDIHGGGWVGGKKGDIIETCNSTFTKNFIVATMSYTLLNGSYTEYNIFRIIDEITAVLKTLKKFLSNLGFDENKLELLIKGGSAGAHLSLLYSYMIKNPPIPIRFILNAVAPVTLNPKYWLTTKPGSEPLVNITPTFIEEAINKATIIRMNGSETGVNMNNIYLFNFMNAWLGRPLNDSIKEVFSDVERREINENSEIFKEMLNKTSYAYPINYVTNESIPTLCLYGGRDEEIGVAHYAQLKKAFDKCNNPNITLVYFKYGQHNVFYNTTDNDYGKDVMTKMSTELFGHCKKYLNSFKYKN